MSGIQTKNGKAFEYVYVRQGVSTVPATETAILRMIKETDGEKYEDISSLNQELTFVEAEREFKSQNISFGKMKTAAMIFYIKATIHQYRHRVQKMKGVVPFPSNCPFLGCKSNQILYNPQIVRLL